MGASECDQEELKALRGKEQRAKGEGESVLRSLAWLLRVFEKFVILRLSMSQSLSNPSISEESKRPKLSKTINIEASSNKDRLAMFQRLLKLLRMRAARTFSDIISQRKAGSSQLLCIAIKSSLVERIRQFVEFCRQAFSDLPNL